MHDVFISYTTANQNEALQIKGILESQGITCWMAPSEIHGSQDFTKRIPPAIKGAKAFLLLMSNAAQRSKWVKRELGVADRFDIPMYTFFLEECQLEDEFDFILQFNQHYKAELGFSEQISRLLLELREDFLDSSKAVRPSQVHKPRPVPGPGKKRLRIFLSIAAVVAALILAAVLLLGGGQRDGEYVIWNPEYAMALTCDVVHDYYLAGESVLGRSETLSSYSEKSVWELDFDGDTFTISRAGQLLGMRQGYNGIGLGGDHIYVKWELVDAGDGYFYIRNKDTGYYLEWYNAKDNWCAHNNVDGNNREMFLVRIDPAE
jgi:hypothetical protein